MTWTTTVPTTPGNYGWRASADERPRTHAIVARPDGSLAIDYGYYHVDFAILGGEWWPVPWVPPWESPPATNLEHLLMALRVAKGALTTAATETSSGYYAHACDVVSSALEGQPCTPS